MSLTLSPAQADLLARTGRPWPDADEDRIVAMADGWRALGSRLVEAYRDHSVVARSIRTRNSSMGVVAFGEWVTRFDDSLQRLVEICAATEAALRRAARTVLTAKNAILAALEDLAAWLDDARRRPPGVSGTRTPPEVLVDTARKRITTALEDVTRQLDDDIRPTLGGLLEVDRRLVQELRELLAPLDRAEEPSL